MAFSHSPRIVTDGLTFYIDASNPLSYPGSGTSWNDLIIPNQSGSLFNSPTNNGKSFIFDGVNEYARWSNNDPFGTGPFSIDIWFKSGLSQPIYSSLVCINNTTNTANWQVSYSNDFNGELGFYAEGSNQFLSTGLLPDNLWKNITIVRENTSSNGLKIYINSSIKSTGQDSADYTDSSGYRIAQNRSALYYFNGEIGLVKIYNSALTPEGVIQNYEAMKGKFGL